MATIFPEEAPYKPSRAALRQRFGSRAIVSYGPESNPRNFTGKSTGSNFDQMFGPKGANGVRGVSSGGIPVPAAPPTPVAPGADDQAIPGVPGSKATPTGYSFRNQYGSGSSTGVFAQPVGSVEEKEAFDQIMPEQPSAAPSAFNDPESYIQDIIGGQDDFMARRKRPFRGIGKKPSPWEEPV